LILQVACGLQSAAVRVPDVTAFSLAALGPEYARLFSETMAGRHSQ